MKLLPVLFLFGLPFLAQAQESRIQKMLDKLEWKFEQTSSGNTQVVFKVEEEEGRTQAVFISNKTSELGDYEIIEIWSYVGVIPTRKIDEEAVNLLIGNEKTKLGAWSLAQMDDNGGFKVIFTAKLFIKDLTAEQLKTICDALVVTCDTKERELEKITGEKDKW